MKKTLNVMILCLAVVTALTIVGCNDTKTVVVQPPVTASSTIPVTSIASAVTTLPGVIASGTAIASATIASATQAIASLTVNASNTAAVITGIASGTVPGLDGIPLIATPTTGS